MKVGEASEFQKRWRILVCAICSYPGDWPQGVHNTLKSAARFGIQVRLFGQGVAYHNSYSTKLIHLGECIEACFNEYDWVLVIDAADSLFLRPLEDIFSLAGSRPGHLFAAERNCWPEPRLASCYPSAASSFRYLNGGGSIGRMADVWRNMELLSGKDTRGEDQHVWAKAMCMNLRLDWMCEVFQTLYMTGAHDFEIRDEGGILKLYNRETGTFPCIAHGNGGSGKSPIFQKLIP
jgi:hypothetical protein